MNTLLYYRHSLLAHNSSSDSLRCKKPNDGKKRKKGNCTTETRNRFDMYILSSVHDKVTLNASAAQGAVFRVLTLHYLCAITANAPMNSIAMQDANVRGLCPTDNAFLRVLILVSGRGGLARQRHQGWLR
jgi:hypothetical protein